MSEPVERYIVALTTTTREPLDSLNEWIEYGASPRATIALDLCARAHAWLSGREFVTPEDVQAIAHDVFRHRLILTFEAQAQGITSNQIIDRLLAVVPTP